jgi:hypothetical protein
MNKNLSITQTFKIRVWEIKIGDIKHFFNPLTSISSSRFELDKQLNKIEQRKENLESGEEKEWKWRQNFRS